MAWLKALPYQERLDAHRVLLCHGSPVRLEEFEYIFAPEQARECLSIWEKIGHITLIGHSHLCKVFALTETTVEELPAVDFDLDPNKKYIVSVGSVGQPRDFDNRASYTAYDTERRRFEFKRVEYDIELAADKVLRARLERNFAHRLFIGV
jgi:diadenosine tetraphosphatase ApaH/serine/threonine PP2A family protein phosphatase